MTSAVTGEQGGVVRCVDGVPVGQVAIVIEGRWVAKVLIQPVRLRRGQRHCATAICAAVWIETRRRCHGDRQARRHHRYRVGSQWQIVKQVVTGDAGRCCDDGAEAVGQCDIHAGQAEFAALIALIITATIGIIPDGVANAAQE